MNNCFVLFYEWHKIYYRCRKIFAVGGMNRRKRSRGAIVMRKRRRSSYEREDRRNLTFFSSFPRSPQGTREMEFVRKKRGSAIAQAEEVMENPRDITRLLRFRKKKANDIEERRTRALHSSALGLCESYAPSDTLMFRKYRYTLDIKIKCEISSTRYFVRFTESFVRFTENF